MMRALPRSARATLAAALLTVPGAALGWGTSEHQEIGSTSYLAACDDVERAVAARPGADGAVRARLEGACGMNRAVLARIYGDATAIAGDFVGHPSELLAPEGAWRFSSPKHYYLLALENSSHFNPMATESWREYHQTALDHALAAAAKEGLPALESFEEALRENAFADHLLQDSFAAGHMGFNRRASSAAAAHRFHDDWNARGRGVTDRAGRTWRTYGDGRLNWPENADGRRHVIDAATSSVRDVLLTFVFARRFPEESLAAWRALPFTIEAPELLVDAQALVERQATARDTTKTPLISAVVPARKNTVGIAKIWAAAAPFDDAPTWAASANVELAIPVLPAQASLGAGGTLHEPAGHHSFVAEFGLLAPLGLSLDGLVSHEVEAAATLIFLRDVNTMIHVEYQGNVEFGTSLLGVHLGLVYLLPAREFGWIAAVGFGFTFTAAGGGAL